MAVFPYGDWIRYRRKMLKLSQEDLSDGICAPTTLSRIENGSQQPSLSILEALLERLGFSNTFLDSFVGEKTFYLHELKFQIRQAYIIGDVAEAKKLLLEFEKDCPNTPVNKQFVLLYHTIFHASEYTPQQMLEQFAKALKLTCPKYDTLSAPKVLFYEEVIAMNAIANCHFMMKQYDMAIDVYYQLKRFYDQHTTNAEEVLRTQPMVLYNLSTALGLQGRYDECIEICEQGIRIARQSGRASALTLTFYNHAWALLKRNRGADRICAKDSAIHAYQMASCMAMDDKANTFLAFLNEHFPDWLTDTPK